MASFPRRFTRYVLSRVLDRTQRLKDARSEAAKEIEEYKKAKEAEFKSFEASVRTITSTESMLES